MPTPHDCFIPTTPIISQNVDSSKFCAILDAGFAELKRYLVQEFESQVSDCNVRAPPIDLKSGVSIRRQIPKERSRSISWSSPSTPNGQSSSALVPLVPRIPNPVTSSRRNTRLDKPDVPTISADHQHVDPTLDESVLFKTDSLLSFSFEDSFKIGATRSNLSEQEISMALTGETCATLASASSMQTPTDRWARMCQLMLRPKTRVRLTGQITYHMHELWATYLRMLVHNENNCQVGFEAATQRIVDSRSHGRSSDRASSRSSRSSGSPAPYIIHPDSPVRRLWTMMVIIMLLHDTFLLPVGAFFFDDDPQFFIVTMWFASIFWAVDIGITLASGKYIDGKLVLKFSLLARRYLKSRLAFDIILVVLDWILLVIYEVTKRRPLGSLGVTLRTVRIIRLVRLFRLGRWQIVCQHVLAISNKSIIAFSGVLKTTVAYLIYCHVLACAWYAIGRASDNGWGFTCGADSSRVASCYATALHWAMTQTHGSNNLSYSSVPESIVATLAVFVGLFQFAFLLGKVIDATAQLTGADKLELRQRCANYATRHKLSPGLTLRVMRFVDANEIALHLDRLAQQERDLLSILPMSMQTEVLEETRKPLLGITILRDLKHVSTKMVTQLCSEAMTSVTMVASEAVFSVGDQGSHWRVVEFGNLLYLKGCDDMWEDFAHCVSALHDNDVRDSVYRVAKGGHDYSRKSTASVVTDKIRESRRNSWMSTLSQEIHSSLKLSPFAEVLTRASLISEMVLWTPWVHTGDLIAAQDCMLLQLNLDALYLVLKVRLDTCLLTARYAQQYVKQLSRVHGIISDLFQYKDKDDDHFEFYGSESPTHHLVFLSHYKDEAGTEATLMQEGFQAIIARDGAEWEVTNVFLDSEDLTDLSGLQEHVMNSKTLVLLLTPGVLLRPWCLVEIVTANMHDVQIVPVEIQRHGISFVYPDADFYAKLRGGEVLNSQAVKLLKGEGISLSDVEEALRSAFTQIALPFSPHKSKGIRDAELFDIMKRCVPKECKPTYPSTRMTQMMGKLSRPSISTV